MGERPFAIGVDLGGTKIEVAHVEQGVVRRRRRVATDVAGGAEAVEKQIVTAVRSLAQEASAHPLGVGVGVAGQIEPGTGRVHFAPNLQWHDVPLQSSLAHTLGLPVVVTNDVRAATWGEWLHGAGKGCDDLICLFVGTGIGGGVVTDGRMLVGANNSAGELGHVTVAVDGPKCHCPNRGCLEALASGWAIAEQAQAAVAADPAGGAALLQLAGGKLSEVNSRLVAQAAHSGDPLAQRLVDRVAENLTAGVVGLVNAFNPACFILGGGVIEGFPELIQRVRDGVMQRALAAATAGLQVVGSQLHNDAGVVGAAAVAARALTA
jgi:glucokinase